ncbi:MAG TPA: peptidylprolyl isomerase [Longimicrobiales bacterium]|nr:peptidylprolyl isomerase [Longimicrobiales bacterium]
MAQVQSGDTVRVHYTGTLDDGTVFDSSKGRDPIEFTVGGGQVIAGFDAAVSGMAEGESKKVTIPAAQAYGERRDELMLQVDRSQFPADVEPQVGQQFQMSQGEQNFVVNVAAVDGEQVTLDANHPLAGQDLTFELELVDVVS